MVAKKPTAKTAGKAPAKKASSGTAKKRTPTKTVKDDAPLPAADGLDERIAQAVAAAMLKAEVDKKRGREEPEFGAESSEDSDSEASSISSKSDVATATEAALFVPEIYPWLPQNWGSRESILGAFSSSVGLVDRIKPSFRAELLGWRDIIFAIFPPRGPPQKSHIVAISRRIIIILGKALAPYGKEASVESDLTVRLLPLEGTKWSTVFARVLHKAKATAPFPPTKNRRFRARKPYRPVRKHGSNDLPKTRKK